MAVPGAAHRRAIRKIFVKFRGGPGFIIALAVLVVTWILWNLLALSLQFDAPPFVLLNLLLSIEAAFTMPVLWMEQQDSANASTEKMNEIARRVVEILKVVETIEDEVENDPS